MVTLVIMTVAGSTARFGSRTASRLLWPWDSVREGVGKRHASGPSLSPMMKVDVRDFIAFADQSFADVERRLISPRKISVSVLPETE